MFTLFIFSYSLKNKQKRIYIEIAIFFDYIEAVAGAVCIHGKEGVPWAGG